MTKILKDKTGTWYGGSASLSVSESKTNARCVAKYCKSLSNHEWKKTPCMAMLGNMWRESHVNPQAQEVGGSGYGLVQWTPKQNLIDRAKKIKQYKSYDMMYTQLQVIDYEADNHIQWYPTGEYQLSFKEFMRDTTHSLDWLVRCFCNCYERAGSVAMDERIQYAHIYNDYIDWEHISSDDGRSIDDFLKWCKEIADDNEYTYLYGANHSSPPNWNSTLKKFDCSSFISFGLHNGGDYDLNKIVTTSTMKDDLVDIGFEAIRFKKSQLKRGDILCVYEPQGNQHTEAVYSINGSEIKLVGAHDHFPSHPNDDISVRDYYDDRWQWILRPFDSPSSKPRENPTNSNKSSRKKNPKTPSANTQNALPPTFLKRKRRFLK